MPAIYVETSVWSHAFAKDAPESKAATLRFLELARTGVHDLYISAVVLDEISRAPGELKPRLLRLIQEHSPRMLRFAEHAFRLAQSFLDWGAVPPKKADDARHVAVAVVNEMDMLVSWNFRHLVNVRRREAFRHISAVNGYYKPVHIITPSEVGDESE